MAIIEIRKELEKIQQEDLAIIKTLSQEITQARTEEEANARAAIITGYANAMRNHRLISEEELKEILQGTEELTVLQYQRIKMAEDIRKLTQGKSVVRILGRGRRC